MKGSETKSKSGDTKSKSGDTKMKSGINEFNGAGKKFHNEQCDNSMTFEECEIAVLRHAVDESEKMQGQKVAMSDEINRIIRIVESFLIKKQLICYGGTAVNNILPKNAQFYNHEYEIPDYDFFTDNAANDAKELADIFMSEGFQDVEAKSGVHYGTFKVFVNFVGVADITEIHTELFDALKLESIMRAGIRYAPPDYLRMSMFLELSRPAGDVSRWEKVLKRLVLLNHYYPIQPNIDCKDAKFQRSMSSIKNKELSEKIFYIVRDTLIYQGAVFFGGYAANLYAKYMPEDEQNLISRTNPDFDVLSEDIELCATIVKEQLINAGIQNVSEIRHPAVGEIVPARIEILVGTDTIAFIYEPIACHNYNVIHTHGLEINVATIDTMLSFYLAFIYTKEYAQFRTRIMCMAKFLFDVEQENRLEQRGVLKRFSMNCIGKQKSLTDLRMEKSRMFHKLKRGTSEFEKWFMSYRPKPQKKENQKVIEASMEEDDYEIPKSTKPAKRNAKKTERVDLTGISSFRRKLLTKRRSP